MSSLNNQLSEVFRNIESDLGATALANLSLDVITEIIPSFQANSVDDFFEQFKQVMELVKNTKPKFGILIAAFCDIWDELEQKRDEITSMNDVDIIMTLIVEKLQKEYQEKDSQLIEQGIACIEDNDVILIHSHSKTVRRIFEGALKNKKKFKIVLAEQQKEKTEHMIEFFQEHKIPFYVVPDYMLSHIEHEVTKVFLGAVTLSNHLNFVTDPGTNSLVAEFHHIQVPIYIFLSTQKFALWESSHSHHTYKIEQKRMRTCCETLVSYDYVKFSHDRLPVSLINYTVTEEGVFSPDQVQTIYNKKFAEREEWRIKHFE